MEPTIDESPLTLDFLASRTIQNKSLFFISYPVACIIIAQNRLRQYQIGDNRGQNLRIGVLRNRTKGFLFKSE
jgi:hypothetical protein